jgi:hypothetical protein
VDDDIRESERREIELVVEHARATYKGYEESCYELFAVAMHATNGFRNVSREAIMSNPTILKVLRYCCAPSYSQMKLGQMVGKSSTGPLEARATPSAAVRRGWQDAVDQLGRWIEQQLDVARFPWLQTEMDGDHLERAVDAAKRITCAVMADQNTLTDLRNWRKDYQEDLVAAALVGAGLTQMQARPTIYRDSDIPVGHFSRECKVSGGSHLQKADFAIRCRDGTLLLLEAKAVGVRVDGYKRMKEVRDKASEWKANIQGNVAVGAVIAGFLEAGQIGTLRDAGTRVYWEHRLEDLQDAVS